MCVRCNKSVKRVTSFKTIVSGSSRTCEVKDGYLTLGREHSPLTHTKCVRRGNPDDPKLDKWTNSLYLDSHTVNDPTHHPQSLCDQRREILECLVISSGSISVPDCLLLSSTKSRACDLSLSEEIYLGPNREDRDTGTRSRTKTI